MDTSYFKFFSNFFLIGRGAEFIFLKYGRSIVDVGLDRCRKPRIIFDTRRIALCAPSVIAGGATLEGKCECKKRSNCTASSHADFPQFGQYINI